MFGGVFIKEFEGGVFAKVIVVGVEVFTKDFVGVVLMREFYDFELLELWLVIFKLLDLVFMVFLSFFVFGKLECLNLNFFVNFLELRDLRFLWWEVEVREFEVVEFGFVKVILY